MLRPSWLVSSHRIRPFCSFHFSCRALNQESAAGAEREAPLRPSIGGWLNYMMQLPGVFDGTGRWTAPLQPSIGGWLNHMMQLPGVYEGTGRAAPLRPSIGGWLSYMTQLPGVYGWWCRKGSATTAIYRRMTHLSSTNRLVSKGAPPPPSIGGQVTYMMKLPAVQPPSRSTQLLKCVQPTHSGDTECGMRNAECGISPNELGMEWNDQSERRRH